MEELIRKTLNHCGYSDAEPTRNELIACFLDYCDSGVFRNLSYDEAKELIEDGEITLEEICRNLLKRVG